MISSIDCPLVAFAAGAGVLAAGAVCALADEAANMRAAPQTPADKRLLETILSSPSGACLQCRPSVAMLGDAET
jgi:hypothetical protein